MYSLFGNRHNYLMNNNFKNNTNQRSTENEIEPQIFKTTEIAKKKNAPQYHGKYKLIFFASLY